MIKRVISELVPSALALLAFFELVFPKVAERAFDHVLNRRMAEFKSILDTFLEVYKDELARASSAHRLIFDQEIRFLTKTDNLLAELILLIQEMRDAILGSDFGELEKSCFLRYLEIIPELKNIVLVYEPGVHLLPMEIGPVCTDCHALIGQM